MRTGIFEQSGAVINSIKSSKKGEVIAFAQAKGFCGFRSRFSVAVDQEIYVGRGRIERHLGEKREVKLVARILDVRRIDN
jgi:hypothetical protein